MPFQFLRTSIWKYSTSTQAYRIEGWAYPGFIVAGGGAGTNPVKGKFGKLIADRDLRSAARNFIRHLEDIHARLKKQFPKSFLATRKTVAEDIDWMKGQTGG